MLEFPKSFSQFNHEFYFYLRTLLICNRVSSVHNFTDTDRADQLCPCQIQCEEVRYEAQVIFHFIVT